MKIISSIILALFAISVLSGMIGLLFPWSTAVMMVFAEVIAWSYVLGMGLGILLPGYCG